MISTFIPGQERNADRLQRAADAVRAEPGAGPRGECVATMLEHCKMIADFWTESYAAPFIPMLEAALQLTRLILDDSPQHTAQAAPQIPAVADDVQAAADRVLVFLDAVTARLGPAPSAQEQIVSVVAEHGGKTWHQLVAGDLRTLLTAVSRDTALGRR
jgi:hypothetical protein